MGSFISPLKSQRSFLLLPVDSSMDFLTKWKRIQISTFYQIYTSLLPSQIYITASDFCRILKRLKLTMPTDLLFAKFQKHSSRVNVLEIIAVLITYSDCDIQSKIELTLSVYDFDHSGELNREEMGILCKSFLRGIRIVCNYGLFTDFEEKKMTNSAFALADKDFDGQITQSELLQWVNGNKVLSQLLRNSTFSNKQKKSRTISHTQNIAGKHRRGSNSIAERMLPSIYLENPSINDCCQLFQSVCNRYQKVQAYILYDYMMNKPKFHKIASIFYSTYRLKLKTELTIAEFLQLKKRVDELSDIIPNFMTKKRRNAILANDIIMNVPPMTETQDEKKKKKALIKVFEKFDDNHDGHIDLKELKAGLSKTFSDKDIEELFSQYDQDCNKLLDKSEFISMFLPFNKTINVNIST